MKKYIGYYSLWAFLHLIFLVLGWDGTNHYYFFPFESSYYSSNPFEVRENYDLSEFLVYVLGPLVLIFATNLIAADKVNQFFNNKSKK
ncbi:hypothetical protein [Aquirufa sp. TARAVU-A1A]